MGKTSILHKGTIRETTRRKKKKMEFFTLLFSVHDRMNEKFTLFYFSSLPRPRKIRTPDRRSLISCEGTLCIK